MSARAPSASSCGASISIEAFEDGAVDPDQFDHEAHIYVGWSYLEQFELEEAIDRFSAALRRLTKKLGVETKYHETITWFFMILIADRRSTSETNNWQVFRQCNADLFARRPSIVSQYYSNERLGTSLARTQFVLPDRVPLT
jgi:hypothetical protein